MSGLYGKYRIEKADGSEADPAAQYFVLRLDTDEAARYALLEYSRNCGEVDLRADLLRWLVRIDPMFGNFLNPREKELMEPRP